METWRLVAVNAEQMAAVDEQAVRKYGVQLIQMMESAGRQLASLAVSLLGGNVIGKKVVVLCGTGNNGGGGMVAARYLHNWGAEVNVILVGETDRLKDIPVQQWRTIKALGLDSSEVKHAEPSLIIDALLGYGSIGNPRSPISKWIDWANNSTKILSLDLPSGLDASIGEPGIPCIHAKATLTLAAPKTGLFAEKAKGFVGDLYLADIGIPPEVYSDLFPNRNWKLLALSDSILKISK